MKNLLANKNILVLAAICIITFICFSYTRHNQFTNWDDDYYVTNDPYIKAFTGENLKIIFTRDITKNNYHPLTMLSLAVNYYFSGLNPAGYYLTNVFIHILNVILIFFLALRLCRRLGVEEKGHLFIAGFCALLFGIHPMRVESVAWIAERKDVLYAFFYFAGLVTYLWFTSSGQKKWYWITFALFIGSCLSKPMAVVFPLSLLCFDFLLRRPIGFKLIMEKIVFFLASLLCGAMAFYTQNKTGAVADFGVLTLGERIMYAAYGYVMYLSKLLNPTYLSTFYPYPYRFINGNLPVIYYAAPYLAVSIPAIAIYMARKKGEGYFRMAMFGFGFFTANVIFVLQFISVGAAIMSDRYSYVAYFGLFFMIVYFLYELVRLVPTVKIATIATMTLICAWMGKLCYERTYVWHDSRSLLGDAIEKYPYRALLSYKWMGNYYAAAGNPDSALVYYGVLAQLRAADANVYENMGRMYNMKGDYATAAQYLQLSADAKAGKQGQPPVAPVASAQGTPQNNGSGNSQKLDPAVEKKVAQRGFEFLQAQKFDEALQQYDVLIELNPNNAYYFFYRGVAHFSKGNTPRAVDDWSKAVQGDIKDVQQSAAYNLSVAYDTLNKDSMAVYYMEMAQSLGYKANPDFVAKLKQKKAEQRR